MDEQHGGQVITPQAQTDSPAPPADQSQQPPADKPIQEPAGSWQFNRQGQEAETGAAHPTTPTHASAQPISWTASEFIAHHKSASWYGLLGLGTVALAAIIYLLTHDKVSTGVVVVAAFILGIYAARKPRVLEYRLDDTGLSVGGKAYSYNLFKSFAVVDEGAFASIVLMPLKRFMPVLTIYYAPEDEPKILKMLSEHLPVEEHRYDAVDSFLRRIRF